MRSCGGCTACCSVFAISEKESRFQLNKPPGVPCEHLVQIGYSASMPCGIYQDRPEPCRAFECVWKQGDIKEEDLRPDKIGYVLWTPPKERWPDGREVMMANEIVPGGLPVGRLLISTLRRQVPVIIIQHGADGVDALIDDDGIVSGPGQQLYDLITSYDPKPGPWSRNV